MPLKRKNIFHPTLNEPQPKQYSIQQGEELRDKIPLESHALFEVDENRQNPVDLLKAQGETRVQELLPLRYERMSLSAFTFYRGGALIMASDLSTTPITGIKVQACGDAHISNFGLFSSPERRTVFDINDFDETLPGPWEWDIKRLAASVEICGRDNGFSKKERKQAVKACVKAYREAMLRFAEMGNLEVWYAHLDIDTLKGQLLSSRTEEEQKQAEKLLKKAKNKNSTRAIRKLTEVVDGKLRIVSTPPLIRPMRDLISGAPDQSIFAQIKDGSIEKLMNSALTKYQETLTTDKQRLISEYTPVDIAHKVVGVGSVGTRAWMMVLQGADANDHLVLQIKEAQPSVLEEFCGKSSYKYAGRRVVSGQRAIQTAGDPLLGWCRLPDVDGKPKDYFVRQLWDGKGAVDLALLSPDKLTAFAKACGWTLAKAHARTGNRFAIAAYLGNTNEFDKALAKFAIAYADQNENDYVQFMKALEAGQMF